MYYMFSKISLVFANWGVSKQCLRSVFGPSQRQCLCLRQLGLQAYGVAAVVPYSSWLLLEIVLRCWDWKGKLAKVPGSA